MALSRKQYDIPKDAIILTKEEALAYQWKLVEEWTPVREVWPIRYGFAVTATVCGLSAFYINNYFRHRLRLGHLGQISSYIPNVIIPTLTNSFFHYEFVASPVLMASACPVCIEVRSAFVQILLSTAYPLITAPLASFNYAMRYNTYRMPSISEKPMEVFGLWKKIVRSMRGVLYYNLVFQSITAMGVAYLEMNSYYNMIEKLITLEETIKNN